MPPVYLVCEGERDSLDILLLDAILAQHHKLPIRLVNVEGGALLAPVRSWHEARERGLGAVAISLKDRDYAPWAEAEAEWGDPTRKAYRWAAHEIENFLLAPWLLHEQFEDFRRTVPRGWVAKLPDDAARIEAMLRALAPRLFNDHIAHVLHYRLRTLKGALGKSELNEPKGVDPLAGTADQWRTALQTKIRELRATCAAITAAPEFKEAAVAAAWAEIEGGVRDPAFLTSGDYRRDLKGKRLMNLLWSHLQRYCGLPEEEDEFKHQLVDTARRVYATVPGYTFPDLERLAARLQAALGA